MGFFGIKMKMKTKFEFEFEFYESADHLMMLLFFHLKLLNLNLNSISFNSPLSHSTSHFISNFPIYERFCVGVGSGNDDGFKTKGNEEKPFISTLFYIHLLASHCQRRISLDLLTQNRLKIK